MSILVFLVSLSLVVVMVKGVQNHKQGGSWGLPAVVGCLVLSVPLMVLNFRGTGSSHQEVRRREVGYQDALGDRLGREIQARFPRGRVVLVSTDTDASPVVEALRRQISPPGRLEVVTPDFDAEVRRMRAQLGNEDTAEWADELEDMLRMEAHLSVAMIDQALSRLQGPVEVVVFLNPLPLDFQSMSLWSASPRPAVILASGQDMWNLDSLRDLLQSGWIHGLIAYNTASWRTDGRVPSDPDKAFEERYHWITAENIGLLDTLVQ